MEFSEKLMRLRKERGFSQEELGNKLGVSRQTISKWELGQTTPEMAKLLELSKLFEISVDELIGNQRDDVRAGSADPEESGILYKSRYEYRSRMTMFGLPLIHINVARGFHMPKAKGIIAIGNRARGIVSIGFLSMGVLSFGLLSCGVLALGAFALAGMALGGIAVGAAAVGGFALGYLALGGCAVGMYSFGGAAIAHRIAMGGHANGHIAVGKIAKGAVEFISKDDNFIDVDAVELRQAILSAYPNISRFILKFFTGAVG